ncbi:MULTISPECIES: hypothetical protein [Pseudomonas]|uniref:Lipoprotein n=1 Tax=Pseudomonas gingeri TaxID=117681 RepID=A0A7Y7WA78_9PSED|nr:MULTISPECIES: hypothetical protein [Pseudomonas]MCU1735790.1 hypothetical protein [Pseudomonas sp. 20S_6.2_Bac1]NWB45586.1 hypothetical protein [Pseudomonas gingeri]
MYPRILIAASLFLALTACAPYYDGGPAYYRSDVYAVPAYYYGYGYYGYGGGPYYRGYYAPGPGYHYYPGHRWARWHGNGRPGHGPH